jgi:hypothetical protein
MRTTLLALIALILAIPAFGAASWQSLEGYKPIETFKLDDFAWVKREVKKAPAFKSEKVKYTFWQLGDVKDAAMLMAWDESGGTGKGYDTLFLDKNMNGDLTEEGECITSAGVQDGMPKYDTTVVLPNGQGSFAFHCVMSAKGFEWQSSFTGTIPSGSKPGENISFGVSLLPGNLPIRSAESLKDAPVYHLGGEALVEVSGKMPGQALGKWTAGSVAELYLSVGLYGDDMRHVLRFYHSHVATNADPTLLLRVLNPEGKRVEDVAFCGGCGCAGSFGQSLLVPSRIPPGKHALVVRLKRPTALGGPADFLFPVEVDNPDYGKSIADPAVEALKTAHPGAKIVSLRRAENDLQQQKLFEGENVLPTRIGDTFMMNNTMHWDAQIGNFGTDPYMTVGQKAGTNAPSRGLIKIDLSALPAGSKILGARLRFTLAAVPYSGSKDAKVAAYAVRREWNETQVEGLGAAWYGPKYGGNPTNPNAKNVMWAKGGCDDPVADRFADAAGSVTVTDFPAKGEKRRLVEMDISDVVRDWASGKTPNNGLVLVLSGGGCVDICSSDFQDFPFRPTLALAIENAAAQTAQKSPAK